MLLQLLQVKTYPRIADSELIRQVMLIVGRAVAGMGAAGLFSGALVIIAHSIKPRQRPSEFNYHSEIFQPQITYLLYPLVYTGIVASMFSISNIVGPILGGAFTQSVS